MGKKLGAALIAAGRAKPFRWSEAFVVLPVRSTRDVKAALALFELAYERRSGTADRELIARVGSAGREAETERG